MSRPIKAVLLFLLLLTGLRLAYIGRVELSPDEAYYQMWSERLDWAYYSKGPGVALAIRAGTALFGDNEFGVRFFSPILSLATSLVLLAFTRRLYGDAVAVWTVLTLNLTPIFQVGSLLMTIDPLSIFFWSLGMFTTWLALERRRVRLPYWLATGVCVGLGFLSKYTNAMELLCILLAMLSLPRWRRELRRPGFYLMLAVAVVISSPPVFWNAHHAWITLNHLHDRGRFGAAFDQPFKQFTNFLATHAGVYSPLLFIGLVHVDLLGLARRFPAPPGSRRPGTRRRESAFPARLRPAADRDVHAPGLQDRRGAELDRPRLRHPEPAGGRPLARPRADQPASRHLLRRRPRGPPWSSVR